MPANAEKIVRDQLEERVVAGSLRTETDPKKLVALLDDRIDLDLRDLRAGPPRALDYANLIDALLARASWRKSRTRKLRPHEWPASPPAGASVAA
jgi:hypothetical protein